MLSSSTLRAVKKNCAAGKVNHILKRIDKTKLEGMWPPPTWEGGDMEGNHMVTRVRELRNGPCQNLPTCCCELHAHHNPPASFSCSSMMRAFLPTILPALPPANAYPLLISNVYLLVLFAMTWVSSAAGRPPPIPHSPHAVKVVGSAILQSSQRTASSAHGVCNMQQLQRFFSTLFSTLITIASPSIHSTPSNSSIALPNPTKTETKQNLLAASVFNSESVNRQMKCSFLGSWDWIAWRNQVNAQIVHIWTDTPMVSSWWLMWTLKPSKLKGWKNRW